MAHRPSEDGEVRTASDELVEHESDGFLCDLAGGGFVQILRRFMALSPEERMRLGRAGRRKAIDRYNWSAFAVSLIEEIQTLEITKKKIELA